MDGQVDEREEQAGARRRAAARIPDIARLAGASTATVDRVLNRRPGVRPATIQRVLKAAAALDYLPDEALVGAGLKPLRIVFVLPEGTNRFLSMLGRLIKGAQNQLAPMNVRCQVETIRSFHPELLAQSLREHGRRADGVAFMALEHPAVREAVNALADQGKPTVTLISDIAHSRRVAYVGLDNRSVGRTAGYLMARLLGKGPAKVAMIAGSLSYRAHEEREMGFLHIFQEIFPQVAVVGLREGQDDEGKNYRQTRMLLAQHPDLAGIYNIGGGPEGVARALREARREQEVVFIGHGLTEETRALLIDGAMDAVITQNPQAAMMSCVNVFANLRAGRDPLHGVEPPRTEIFFRENLP